MSRWWLAVGPRDYWQVAFEQGSIWGLRATPRHDALWEVLSEGDGVLFYATLPVGGVIGYGEVRRKFKQDRPLWPLEVKEGKVMWPNRFEFDVKYLLPQDRWETHKFVSDSFKIIARSGFQIVKQELANEVIKAFPIERVTKEAIEKVGVSLHEEILPNTENSLRRLGLIPEAEEVADIIERLKKEIMTGNV